MGGRSLSVRVNPLGSQWWTEDIALMAQMKVWVRGCMGLCECIKGLEIVMLGSWAFVSHSIFFTI